MVEKSASASHHNFGQAWLVLSLAFAAQFGEQVLRGFLEYYNATVLTLYGHFSWFPRLDMQFRSWFLGLAVACVALLALTPLAYRNKRFLRPVAYLFVGTMFSMGIGDICATILGRTVPSVHFSGTAPGFYSSPLLLAASAYLFVQLRRSSFVRQ